MLLLVHIIACRRQDLIWPKCQLILRTNCSEMWTKLQEFSYQKNNLKMSSAKWQPFGLISLNVLKVPQHSDIWIALREYC